MNDNKRFTVADGLEDVICWEINDKENEDMTCGECAELLNDFSRLAEANEEQCLAIMTYLHDNYYDIWEEVNKELKE